MKKLAERCFCGKSSCIIPLILLALTIVLFEITDWDMAIQRHFYSPEHGWLIHFNKHKGIGFFYYTLPDILLGTLGGLLLIYTVWKAVKHRVCCWKAIYVMLCLALVPTVVLCIKNMNSMPYPSKITEFGGKYQRRTLVEAFTHKQKPGEKRYRGWPAGHASGSCALIALAFVATTTRRRWFAALLAAAACAFTGMGHTMDGNHFFSHNLVSFFLAWLTAALLFLALQQVQRKFTQKSVQTTPNPHASIN